MTFKYKELVEAEPEGTFRYGELAVAEPNIPTESDLAEIKNEQQEIGEIVDISDSTGVDLFTVEQIYPPLSSIIKAIPDPKDITIEAVELPVSETPMKLEAAEPKKSVLEKLFGFRYPPKPPDWDRASLIERFNFITLPISDFLGRIGGKIATDWRLTTKEKVQTTLAHELADDLKWYQKTPEAIGWTSEKVAEYFLLKGIFKASGLHQILTTAGQKAAAPFLAKEITARGGIKTVSTLSLAGLKNISRKALTSFLTAAPENAVFIGSWSGLDAAIQGESPQGIADEVIRGAGWGLGLTAGLSMIAPTTQVPELRLAFGKAMANVGKRYPKLIDKLGKPIAKDIEKEWLKALSKSRGKDLRLIDLTTRERAIFRNAIRAAEREILKAAEKEAAIKAYWASKVVKPPAQPTKPAAPTTIQQVVDQAETEMVKAGDIVLSDKVIEEVITSLTKAIPAPEKPAEPITKPEAVEVPPKPSPEVKEPGARITEPEIGVEKPKVAEQRPAKKGTYTSMPKEWHTETDLYDWGKKGLRSKGNVKIGKRKTFIWQSEFDEIPVRLPKPTMDAFRERTDEVFKVHTRKGDDYYLVPKQVVKEVRAELGENAFKQRPAPERSPLQKLNDTINSAKRRDLTDAEIGAVIEGYAETLGLAEKDLSANQKKYIEALNNEPEAKAIRESFREGVEQEVPPTEEIEERLGIQEQGVTEEVGDFLDGLIEEPRPTDLIGRPILEGGVAGEQAEFLAREDFLLPEPDIEGQLRLPVGAKGIALAPRFGAIKELYNRAHDWILTFGQAKREAPELYEKLMSAYGKRNAGVEKAIDQVDKIMPKEIKLADDVTLAMTYEDKRLEPPAKLKDTYDKFANLLDELEKRQLAEGIFQRPFQERMIEENNIKIAKLSAELKHPDKSKQIKRLLAENEALENMRYLSHGIVAKRTIESKINTLSGEKRQAFMSRLSAFYKKRTGKMFLEDYLKAGLITKEDMRMSRLATEELADYYVRSANKSLYDYAKAEGYIKPTSKALRAEGWLNQKELGISSLELKDKLVHPLFGSALAEMTAMRKGRGSFLSQIFGMVKQGQFIKPSIIWVYNTVQKYMKGMYSLNPITEAKALVKATRSVLSKDALYHELNDSNLFQFPYEVSRGAREDEITKFIHQHSAEIDRITKIIEKTTDTTWISPDMTAGKVVKNIIMAAHRSVARITWSGDKIQRTQSYLILRKMGYGHDEAVKVAAASHGGYSLLSEKYKKFWSKKLFVYSFRYLMPVEMSKIITEPIIAAKDTLGGKDVPKHKWERMVKAVIGTAFIPLAIDTYMDWRGFEKEGKHLGPLAWKWKKTVMVDGQKREIVVGVNDILNMPVKYWNRITRYNPIRPEARTQQAFENLLKWELHPLYRIFFWDINDNRRSFGTGVEVYDKSANIVIQTGQVAKYIFGQSFRFWGGMMDAIGEGSMTEKERREQEKIFDSALSGLDKFLFTALGYAYTRQPIEERQAIMGKYLQKELTSRAFEIARKYEGEELEKRKVSLKEWAEKCEAWIKKME